MPPPRRKRAHDEVLPPVGPIEVHNEEQVGEPKKKRNGNRRRSRNELSGAPTTRAGGLKKNLLRAYKGVVPTARELPPHLKVLLDTISQDHRQMAIINYEGALLSNLVYAYFINQHLPLPALDMQTYLAAFNAVSEKDTNAGRPTALPFFETPTHPLLKLLREATGELKGEDSGESIAKPKDDSPVMSYNPTFKLDPWKDPDGFDATSDPWVRLQSLINYVLTLEPDHAFVADGFRWHIKHLRLVLQSFMESKGAYTSLLSHLNSDFVWEHKLRPPHLTSVWQEVVNESYLVLRDEALLTSRAHMNRILNARAAECATCANNHVLMNLRNRVLSFVHFRLEHTYGVSTGRDRGPLVAKVVDSMFDKPDVSLVGPGLEIYQEMASVVQGIPFLRWRSDDSLLPLNDSMLLTDQTRIPAYLHLFAYFESQYRKSDQFECQQPESPVTESDYLRRPPKSKFMHFSLLPLASFQGVMITYGKDALFDLVRSLPCSGSFKSFQANMTSTDKDDLFREVFHYDEKQHIAAYPSAGIKTDGVSIRLLYTDTDRSPEKIISSSKQRLESDTKQVKQLRSHFHDRMQKLHVIGLDPGRHWPFTAVNLRRHKNGRYHMNRISNGHYHHLNGSNQCWRWRWKRLQLEENRHIRQYYEEMPSGRTCNVDDLAYLVLFVVPKLRELVSYSITKKTKSWRFFALQRRQSAIEFLVKRILCVCGKKDPPGKKGIRRRKKDQECKCNAHRFQQLDSEEAAIVAYGAANFNTSSSGCAPSPNASIARALQKHGVKVAMVDEFRSSKLCCSCHTPLVSIDGRTDGHHALLRCSNSNCHKRETIWNRDVNAAINMASLLLYHVHHSRPSSQNVASPRSSNFRRGTPVQNVIERSHSAWFSPFALSLIPIVGV